MTSPLDVEPQIAIVVDLDGTLVHADTLFKSFASVVSHPLAALRSLALIAKCRVAFKRYLAERSLPDCENLPRWAELIDILCKGKTRGREIHLVTAADQRIAEEVAWPLGPFDSATGSDVRRNVKVAHMRDRLRAHTPTPSILRPVNHISLRQGLRPLLASRRRTCSCDRLRRQGARGVLTAWRAPDGQQ
jgi:hypothetical protein